MPTQSSLTNSPAEIVRQVIIDLGLGTDPTPWAAGSGDAWPVFASNEPSSPDNCITVYDTQGIDHGQAMPTLELFQHYGFQIRVRSTDHQTGWQKANAIRLALSQYQATISGGLLNAGSTYLVWALAKFGQILPLGKETPSSKRSLFTVNGQAAIDQTA